MTWDAHPNRAVFNLYAALLASGYDLTSVEADDPIAAIIEQIRSHRWDPESVSYFREARIEGQGVNPYWPRAAMLLNASFHLRESAAPGFEAPDEVINAITRFPTEVSHKDAGTFAWIGRFPEMQRRFASDPLLGDLWDHFRGIMNGDRIGHFQKAGEDAVRMVVEGLNAHIEELPHLVVVPNPLQAPQVADFVRKKDRLYAVVAIARPLSIAHELLHSVFEKALARESALIAGYRHLFTPDVVTAMQRYQYAWDSGGESWLRVFEESLVRAATIWIGCKDDTLKACEEADAESRQGFVYVPAILKMFEEKWRGPHALKQFIRDCLEMMSHHIR